MKDTDDHTHKLTVMLTPKEHQQLLELSRSSGDTMARTIRAWIRSAHEGLLASSKKRSARA